ncbi:MAG: hypothetical protein HKL80_07725 [Acidimicrobiales bacterium]|nr:hypothetical protein [Acidimicrobiales bacterium]
MAYYPLADATGDPIGKWDPSGELVMKVTAANCSAVFSSIDAVGRFTSLDQKTRHLINQCTGVPGARHERQTYNQESSNLNVSWTQEAMQSTLSATNGANGFGQGAINYVAGARYFSIPTDVWNFMSSANQWAPNVKFLHRGIAANDTTHLATPMNEMRTPSPYAEEVKYLLNNHPHCGSAGNALVPDG